MAGHLKGVKTMYAVMKKAGYMRDFPSSKTGAVIVKPVGGQLMEIDECGTFNNAELGKVYCPCVYSNSKLWVHDEYLQSVDSHVAAVLRIAENVLGTTVRSKVISWYNGTDSGKNDTKPADEAFCTVGALWAIAHGTDLGSLISRTAAKLETKARNRNIWYSKDSTYDAQPGDLVLFKATGKTKATHTELLCYKNGSTIYTINFNSDGYVRRVKRSTTGSYVYGFVHIEY